MSATASNTITGRNDEEKSRATGSAAGETSHARTMSNEGSEVDFATTGATQLPVGGGTRLMEHGFVDVTSVHDLRALVARLEDLQAQPTLKSPQQLPSSKRYLQQRKTGGVHSTLEQHDSTTQIEQLIEQATHGHPEQRMRMASMTKSAWLRQKILGHQPKGGRMAGSSTLGSSYGWRHEKLPMNFTDHNWPTVAVNPHGSHLPGSYLPGGDHRHTRLLRCPVEKMAINPTIDQMPNYTLTKDKRWWGCKDNGELDRNFQQNRQPPGPGAYFKSLPRGPHFGVDAGETVVLGANHPCPWKSPMGQHINPTNIHVLSEHHSAPKHSFSKSRRSCSDTFLGHGQQAGGPVKTDEGCLSPGHVYEAYTTFSSGPSLKGKRRTRNTSSAPRMRVHPVPPEPDAAGTGASAEDEWDATQQGY